MATANSYPLTTQHCNSQEGDICRRLATAWLHCILLSEIITIVHEPMMDEVAYLCSCAIKSTAQA